MRRQGGFSLVELLVSLGIVVILLGIALPAYRQSVINTNRSVAKLALLEVAARQLRYWQAYHRHSVSLAELGLAEPYYLDASAEVVGRDRAIYELRLDWREGEYLGLSAIPLNGQAADRECAAFTYGPQGQRSVSGHLAAEPGRCW